MTAIRAIILVSVLAITLSLFANAAPHQGDDLKKTVREIAGQLQKAEQDKKDTKAVKELAAKTGKSLKETIDLMDLFRLRDKGGLGVGVKPGPTPARDGIEAMIRELARNVPPAALKDIPALEEMGYTIAAMGLMVDAKGPPATADAKGKKLWHEYAHDTETTGIAFAKAVASKNPATIKLAATKVNIACGGCHAFFR